MLAPTGNGPGRMTVLVAIVSARTSPISESECISV